MSARVTSSAFIGLVLLGVSASLCNGLYDLDILPQLPDMKDTVATDNNPNLRLMQVTQQYGSEVGGRTKRSASPPADAPGHIAEHPVEKRATPERSTTDDMGFKSRPGFRSWGGKRARFANWGGKRGKFTTWGGKRSKFNNWGGKRSDNGYGDPPGQIVEFIRLLRDEPGRGEKREKFQNWGGKRDSFLLLPRPDADAPSKWSEEEEEEFEEQQRIGKRDSEYPEPYEQETEWDDLEYGEDRMEPPEDEAGKYGSRGRKRSFSNWEGKRMRNLGRGEEFVTINWILRNYFDSLLNMLKNDMRIGKKNFFQDESESTKQGFSAWKGRR